MLDTHIQPRPVWLRFCYRLLAPHDLLPPTKDEIDDAHAVVAAGPITENGLPDPLHAEAVRVLQEAEDGDNH
jgi:hypothetical protein